MKYLKSLFGMSLIAALAFTFIPEPAFAGSCHTNGGCLLAGCPDTGTEACTYMDCGSGTELCMKGDDNPPDA